jgi:hypothetical protein
MKKPGDPLRDTGLFVGWWWSLLHGDGSRIGRCCLLESLSFLPSVCTFEGLPEKLIRELSHRELSSFGLPVEHGDKEPGQRRRVMTMLRH